EIKEAANAEPYLRHKLERGERMMGFGHRVYKVRDPRADVLSAAAERLFRSGGDMQLYNLVREVERTAIRLLEEYKPGRRLQTNSVFTPAFVRQGLGLPLDWSTPPSPTGRTAGWPAQGLNQQEPNRLIRPQSVYTGVKDRQWVAIEAR